MDGTETDKKLNKAMLIGISATDVVSGIVASFAITGVSSS
jgi:hypothetical protein